MTMPNEFRNAQKFVTAVRREHKRHAEAVAREAENHRERLAEIEKDAQLTDEERAIADMVMKRDASNGSPPATVPDLETDSDIPPALRRPPPEPAPGSTVVVDDKPKRGR